MKRFLTAVMSVIMLSLMVLNVFARDVSDSSYVELESKSGLDTGFLSTYFTATFNTAKNSYGNQAEYLSKGVLSARVQSYSPGIKYRTGLGVKFQVSYWFQDNTAYGVHRTISAGVSYIGDISINADVKTAEKTVYGSMSGETWSYVGYCRGISELHYDVTTSAKSYTDENAWIVNYVEITP